MRTVIIQDKNFYRRLVALEIVPKHPDQEVQISLLRKVKELDLSDAGIRSVDELGYFDRLQRLNVSGNKLSLLDLSQNPGVRFVEALNNRIRELKLGDGRKLHFLHVGGNQLDRLDLPEGNGLFELSVSRNRLKRLDVSGCKELRILDASHNRLRALDVSGCSLLYLQVEKNRLRSLELIDQKQLEYVNAEGNPLTYCMVAPWPTLRYLLLEENKWVIDYYKNLPEFSAVQFKDPYPLARNSFQWYFFKAMEEVAEEQRTCMASGSDYHFCADMMKMRLYDLLRKYDYKRRLYRYEKGTMVLTFPVICMLNLLYQEESYPAYNESQFDYSVTKRTYYQEASMLDMYDFPTELVLIVKGREIIFDSDEIAFTSVKGFPEELGYVRYIERITGKKRAQRSMVIWND